MHFILLAVLAQTAPPLVQAQPSRVPLQAFDRSEPRVERQNGKVCVIETEPDGSEVQHCRDEGHEYSGAPKAPLSPAGPVATVHEAPDVEQPVVPSQLGFTMSLGGAFQLSGDSPPPGASGFAYHGRLGVRYALLSREEKPDRPNVSFSLLAGGDVDGIRLGGAFEGRLEAGVGGTNQLYEPVFSVFFSGGAQYLGTSNPEFHVGGGANLDLLCTGLLGKGFWVPSVTGSSTVLGAILLALTPELEVRYVMRADGTHYTALMLSSGM